MNKLTCSLLGKTCAAVFGFGVLLVGICVDATISEATCKKSYIYLCGDDTECGYDSLNCLMNCASHMESHFEYLTF